MDSIATVIAIETGSSLYAMAGAAVFGNEPPSLAGVHGGGLDRGGDIVCWAAGGDPAVLAGYLDPEVAAVFGVGDIFTAGGARLRGRVRGPEPHGAHLAARAGATRRRPDRGRRHGTERRAGVPAAARRPVAPGRRGRPRDALARRDRRRRRVRAARGRDHRSAGHRRGAPRDVRGASFVVGPGHAHRDAVRRARRPRVRVPHGTAHRPHGVAAGLRVADRVRIARVRAVPRGRARAGLARTVAGRRARRDGLGHDRDGTDRRDR